MPQTFASAQARQRPGLLHQRWLRDLPFVSQLGESCAYHDVVRAAMLRLRRAEAPAEWRTEQNLLAQANSRWASESAKEADSTWDNAGWVDYTREETYHLLCANPHGNLLKALATAVKAAERGPIRARQWAALIADAGRDANNAPLREWGQRLTDCIHGDDLSHEAMGRYEDALADFGRVLARQEAILGDRRPGAYPGERRPSVHLVIGQAALHQQVDSVEVIDEQLRVLARAAADSGTVTVQVLPFDAGAHAAAADGSVEILQFSGVEGLGLVHIGGIGGGVSLESEDDLAAYAEALDQLQVLALSPAQSALLLCGMAAD